MTVQNSKQRFWFLCIVMISIMVSACNSTKYLNEGETLLEENKIEIVSEEEIENKYLFNTSINNLINQEPNTNWFFFLPREYVYFKNSAPSDSSWYNRFLRNYISQDPSIYDESKAYETAYSIENYLVNKKGFYDAEVKYEVITGDQKTKITYKVDPKKRYKINSIEYLGNDNDALQLLESIRPQALIEKGDYIDAGSFDLELTRMSIAMQNQGYANFATNYLSIKGDSSLNNHSVDIFLELMPPLPDSTHQKYTIGDINIYTDFHKDQDTSRLNMGAFKDRFYHSQSEDFLVKPSSLDNAIFLRPGSIYNREARSKTRRKLSELGSYRFVTLSAKLDEVHDSIINYNIMLTPFQKKWVADFGWDFFISSTSQTSNGSNQVFGFSLNNQWKNRNFLGGAEQFTLSAELGMEIQIDSISSNSILRSRSIGINAAMEIPKQKSLLGLSSSMKLFGKDISQSFKENTTTTVRGGYNYNDLVDNYSRSSLNASLSYNFKPNKTSRFVIRQLGLEYNDYELTDTFFNRIENNSLLLRSFDDNLLTGLLFRDITYIYNKPVNSEGNSFTFISNFELSGGETFLANKLYNLVSGSNSNWRLTNNIEFAKYARLELDSRFYEYFSDNHSFAARLYAGVIIPYGESTAAPFFKQFSVGGPNSLRGWDQKELGPGGYSEQLLNPKPEDFGQPFFQTGDIKLEANAEYRFDLFYIFEMALFMDAGNVWTLKANKDRPDANISSDFTKQIAVSAGYGFRFDFTYFNIRFDFGYKLRDPFLEEVTDSYWYSWAEIKDQKFGNFQVAVNYPF
ncbi:MAG: outer membrane protein insertion porin family [Saprospiraceae bacterium]|jgi:outer membrane protein assembly factor BamA